MYLQGSEAIRYFQRTASGTSGSMVKINKSVLENLQVFLPPHTVQEKIADLAIVWDIAIEKTQRLIAAKENRLSWLYKTIISNRYDSWFHLKTQEIFETISEKNHPIEELLSVTQDRGVIPRNMLEGRVMSPAAGSIANYKLIKQGDFVISLRSFQGGVEYSKYRGIISPAYTVLRRKIEIDEDFFRHFFKTHLFIAKYLRKAVIGIRDGKQISIPDFMTVKIPVPPLEEQKRGLLQKLLTGQWRVKMEEVVDE